MAPVGSSSLTKIGFRRDIKIFLALLVGFFATLIAILLILLQGSIDHTQEAISENEAQVADVAAAELRRIVGAFDQSEFDSALVSQRTRLSIDAVDVQMNNGRKKSSGRPAAGDDVIERRLPGGRVRYYFDSSVLHGIRTRYLMISAITVLATAAGTILLFLYLPQILRPIEAMLGDARELGEERSEDTDEASYLIETFRRSIATMKQQEIELKRLHDIEKSRADDLQTITSTLTRSLTSGFIAIDPDGRPVDMNSSAREILAVAPDLPVEDQSIATLLGDSPFAQRMEQAVREREPLNRQEIEVAHGGQTRIIGLTTVPLFADASRFLGTLALFADLTLVRRLEWRVRELQGLADLGVMSAGIAHEFRNSLSTILGFLKLAKRNELAPEVESRVTAAEKEALELADAVSSLLQFARPISLQLTDVDLRGLIEAIVKRLEESAPGVHFDMKGDRITVPADASVLSRALENVLRNAIDATKENPSPWIGVTIRAQPHPTIVIEDNGTGVEEQDTSSLFLPFHSTKSHGVGMGLPLARKIVLLHGGTISIANRENGGAVVQIELMENPAEVARVAEPLSA